MAALCLNLGGGRWVGEWWVAIAIVGGTPPFYGYALFALASQLYFPSKASYAGISRTLHVNRC